MKARVLTYENEVSNNLTIKKLDLIETKNENLFLHEIGKDTAYMEVVFPYLAYNRGKQTCWQ
jgi:hypothetical protein